MLRRLILFLSLTMFIVGTGLWIGSYSARSTMYYWVTSRHHMQFTNTCGVIMAVVLRDFPTGVTEGFSKRTIDNPKTCSEQGFLQPWYVAFLPWISRPTPTSWMVSVQIRPWLFVVLGLIYPLYVFAVRPFIIRRRRAFKGLCVHCAYDLTGNTSGVCPECGQSTPAPPQQSTVT